MKILLLLGLVLIILGVYFFNFNDYLSSDQSIWAAFGDYVGGILNPAIAFFVFYYVIKNYESQQKYFRKQEFENHFFKLYDEFKLELEKIHESSIFVEYNRKVSEDAITDIDKYKEWIYSRSDYPRSYFNLLEFLLTYIYENKQIVKYSFFIKNKLSNLDLAYVALHDMATTDKKYSEILEKFNFYEYFDAEGNEVHDELTILEKYQLLDEKLSKWKINNDN